MSSISTKEIVEAVESFSPSEIKKADETAHTVDGVGIIDVIKRTMRLYSRDPLAKDYMISESTLKRVHKSEAMGAGKAYDNIDELKRHLEALKKS